MKTIIFAITLMLTITLTMAADIEDYVSRNWRALPEAAAIGRKATCLTEEQRARLEIHHRYVEKYAPHWLAEYAAMEKVFGWPEGTAEWLQFVGDSLSAPPPHECTSWIVMPSLSENGGLILHKNRDAKTKSLGLNRMSIKGKHAWLGLGNLGILTPCMGVNECALAIVMNSGSNSDAYNASGLTTPELCRILLEECGSAETAVEMLRRLVADGAYTHGKRGSIWLIADARLAFIVEHDAAHFAAHEVKDGLAVRANTWHYPEAVPYVQDSPKLLTNNYKREFTVRQTLLNGGKITLTQVAAASRWRETGEGIMPVCLRGTCSAVTFTLHPTFPRDLSTAWFAFGPPAHTVFLPVPITLRNVPPELMDGTFMDGAFRRQQQDLKADDAPYVALDSQLRTRHMEALARAEALLADGRQEEAQAELEAAFRENWKTVQNAPVLK